MSPALLPRARRMCLWAPALALLAVSTASAARGRVDPTARASDRPSIPVQYVNYHERGKWVTWQDERFRLRIPADWSIVLTGHEPLADPPQWTYELRDASAEKVFGVLVTEGGPVFISCLCAPRSDYEYTEKEGMKTWAHLLDAKAWKTRTIKLATRRFRLDIHASWHDDSNQVRYIAESARLLR